jgi:hypothetical protein
MQDRALIQLVDSCEAGESDHEGLSRPEKQVLCSSVHVSVFVLVIFMHRKSSTYSLTVGPPHKPLEW